MKIEIEEMVITYAQDGDSCDGEDSQLLEIKTQDAGGGKYYVIKTNRWAVDNPKELINIFRDFQSRLSKELKQPKVNE